MYIKDISYTGGIQPAQSPGPRKIEPAEISKITKTDAAHKVIDKTEIDRIAREDARILEASKLIFDALPDIRADKVALAKRRLKEGFYDRPEIKAQIARELGAAPEAKPEPPMIEQKADVIRDRMKAGFYDTPEARAQIARGLIDDALEGE